MKERILKSAKKLFMKNGYKKTTLNNIVKDAETSIGNCYFYYKNKESLLTTILLNNIEERDKIVQDIIKKHNVNNLIQRISIIVYVYSFELLNDKEIIDLYIMGSSFPKIRKTILSKIRDIFNRYKNFEENKDIFNEEFAKYIDILPILYKSIIIDLSEAFHLGDFDRSKEEMLEFMVRWILKSFGINHDVIDKNLKFLSSIIPS